MMQSSACASEHATEMDVLLPEQSSIMDLFGSQVLARPFAEALEVNAKSLSYAALSSQVDRLASRLSEHGIGRGDVVAVCLKRTENLVIALLGILRAGAAYLPLNCSDPSLRLQRVIEHAACRCVVTDSRSQTSLPAGLPFVVLLDQQLAETSTGDKEIAPSAPAGADLAYVIYTSGTTGSPKGVQITHASLLNIVADMSQRLGFTENGSWLAVTNVSFDIAALELLLPLCYGGKVILASEEQARIGRVLAGILKHKRPTVMQATPITWRILIESGWAGQAGLTILCGGDRLDRDLATQLLARADSVWNMYGPTETTIWSTADKLGMAEQEVTLGRPVANTEVYVLDAEAKPCSDVGEIYIGGAGVARGYLRDPQLTSQSFLELDLGEAGKSRVYRTGDLGRWNAQGKLEFHGRIDHQVKINGFRIELAEIECVIRGCTGVVDVAVLGVNSSPNQKRLHAFVVGRKDAVVTTPEIVAHLTQHLPKHMIPDRFWCLERLPSTPNGKRDVRALEDMARANAGTPG